MKKFMLVVGVALLYFTATRAQDNSSTEAKKDTAQISFAQTTYDEGSVKPGSHTFEFEFANTGTKPLVLTNVAPSCGCTIADWPKEPIMPGKKGVIKATYNASGVGNFQKNITVHSNAQTPTVVISFKVNVTNPADEAKATN